MSYILNALRKSEQDRQARQNDDPGNRSYSLQSQQKPVLLWLLITIIIMNSLALVYFLSVQFLTHEPTSDKIVKQPLTESVQQSEKQTRTTKSKPTLPQPVLTKKTPRKTEPGEQSSISDLLKHQRINRKPSSKQTVKLSQHSTKPKPFQPKKSFSDSSETKAKPEPGTVKKAKKPNSDIPYLYELSPQFRRNIPDLNINVFVYAQNPEDRFIIIDMKKYTAGQEIKNGLEIKEIKDDSLVLYYQNKTFQIKRP